MSTVPVYPVRSRGTSIRADGFVMTPTELFSTPTYAVVSESVDVVVEGPDWVAGRFLGTVRVHSESGTPVFVGIAREGDVAAYLGDVRRAVVTKLGPRGKTYAEQPGGSPRTAPAQQTLWAASAVGAGEHVLDWKPQDGTWNLVVMNADGSRTVEFELSIGAELDPLLWVGLAALALGGVLLLGAAALLYAGATRQAR